ncbi:beta-lactamase/transpeptidase-like protein [Roridomyces roridus]|uniref:Beta-lactamase/transpeptidase-like protein n=1 Tax=Roridomyces roridus TaxID=1738132 RepID=A0AAD7FE19_9AGAR|nr:beta-lactamase/transpeptidase-like protein [Roridomyces roridus]
MSRKGWKAQYRLPPSSPRRSTTSWATLLLTGILSAVLALFAQEHFIRQRPPAPSLSPTCHPPLPNIFAQTPIHRGFPGINKALQDIDAVVNRTFFAGGIDGLAVAVVTGEGAIYEATMGPLRANETTPESRGAIDRHSIFRIASGSKLFATLETLVLRERGALQLDDPVDKFFPNFLYAPGGWIDGDETPATSGQITLRQLASHMSGLTREFPRGDMKNWPYSLEGTGPPPINGRPFPTTEEVISGLKNYPLTVPTYSYPIYSNVGMALLGQVAVAANAAFEASRDSPGTWAQLARRDIFGPLGMNGSNFVVTSSNKAHVAVASKNSDEVDLDFLDAMSCSGGQMSSLSDYIKVMRTILDPTRPESLLPPHVIREWLRPIHGWMDDTTEVGMLWEIEKIRDSYSRPVRIFQKLGVLGASRSVFAVNQEMSYGVAILMTGTSSAVGDLALEIFRRLQPTLDRLLASSATRLYSGGWISDDSEIIIAVNEGSLWVTQLQLKGSDVLRLVQDNDNPQPITVWSTGRPHEFRMAFTLASRVCMRSWATIDDGFARGYPTDLIYFAHEVDGMKLHVPSVNLVFARK